MEYKEKCQIIQYLINLSYRNRQWVIQEGESLLYQQIQMTLDRLSVEQRQIIINDFIIKQDKNWYLEFYSRSTYYRLKNDAMNSFLNCLGFYKMI